MNLENSELSCVANGNEEIFNENKEVKFGQRHILAVLGFVALFCMYSMQTNLSVAIVAMVRHDVTHHELTESCPFPYSDLENSTSDSNSAVNGEFLWDEKTQGLILGSIFYAFGLANILGGRAAEHFGGRLVTGAGIVMAGILTLLIPTAARSSSGTLIALRVLQGASQGLAQPSLNSLIAKWYTTSERSKFASFIFTGSDFGNVITLAISGWLCSSDVFGGWPSVFYIPGVLSLIWGVFWFLLVRDDPRNHPRISKEELKYIVKGCPDSKENCSFPWLSVLTSKYFWTIAVVQAGSNFGYTIILTELPTYLDKILHVRLKTNGILSASLYIASGISGVLFGFLTGKAIARGRLTILSVRKFSMIWAGYGPMLCMVGMCFVNCNTTAAISVLIIIGIFNGGAYCGFFSSHADIAPRFAGTLMGLTNAIGSIACFTGPAITGIITEGNQTIGAWRTVFIICALMYMVTTTVYEIFITTERQKWNDPKNVYDNETQKQTERVLLDSNG